ncbi:MAG TPA: hypothetical protein VNH11_04500 [Pirellulales bacterium]|nr:hypothetical protein [Pirellulales bacterium]
MTDFLDRNYLSSLQQFPENTRQLLLRGSSTTAVRIKDPSKKPPSAPVSDDLPKELRFLGGHLCNLGFDKLGLPQGEIDRIYRAFAGEGVAVPGTLYKLRHSVMSMFTFVEPAKGGEVTLPGSWRQTVRSDKWLGKKVAAVDVDLSQYKEEPDGYILKEG